MYGSMIRHNGERIYPILAVEVWPSSGHVEAFHDADRELFLFVYVQSYSTGNAGSAVNFVWHQRSMSRLPERIYYLDTIAVLSFHLLKCIQIVSTKHCQPWEHVAHFGMV